MARQRIALQEGSASATLEPDLLDRSADMLVREAARTPGQLMSGLSRADPSTRTRALQRLQAGLGNAVLSGILGAHPARTTIQRDEETDGTDGGPQPLDTGTTVGGGATEVVGPPVPRDHALSASSLADVASIISGMPEAGKVGWSEEMKADGTPGKGMHTVSVVVKITLDMPTWDPPASMLPLARAEWQRWLGALQAHEQGHIDLVHEMHDGIAAKIMGKSKPVADTLWADAQAALTKNSKAYDVRTGHGLKTGTVLNVKIETDELAAEEKKKAAAAKAATPNSATTDDVTGE